MKEIQNLKHFFNLYIEGDQLNLSRTSELPLDKTEIMKDISVLKKHKRGVLDVLRHPSKLYNEIVAVDVETTHLYPTRGIIKLISVVGDKTNIVTQDVAQVASILKDSSILKVFHNAPFDITWLKTHGFAVNSYSDTMVMSQVINNQVKAENSLKFLAKKHFNIELDKSLQSSANWQEEITLSHKNYCQKDAEVTLALYHILQQEIEGLYLEGVLRREIGALDAVIELNRYGILFDYENWESELIKMSQESEDILSKVRTLLDCPDLNLGSPAQIIAALRDKGIEVEGTSDEVLVKYENKIEAVAYIRKYKKLRKQITSYGGKLKAALGSDGRLRGNWRSIGTDTSRMTCKQPNLQGMPGIAKQYFHPPEGYSFIVADYSNIELRILAEITRDPELVKAFIGGEDLHTKTARIILGGLGGKEISTSERKIGKVVNFGLVYGMTKYGLRKKLNAKGGNNFSLKDADVFRNRYFELYQGVLHYQDQMLKSDFIETLGGRYWSKENGELPRGSIPRFNYPIQASGAEGLKEALALLTQRKPIKWKIVAVVHDEIVLEVPDEDVEIATITLKETMIEGMANILKTIPVTVDIKSGKCWIKD